MQVFAGGEGDAAAGGFSRDGKRVLVGSADGSLRIFNPKTGACEHAFAGRAWEAPVTCVAQSAGGELIAATGMDGTVRVVNVAAKKVVLAIDHNEDDAAAALPGDAADEEEKTSAECAAFCDAQPWFASGATNGVVVVSDLSSFSVRLRLRLRGGCTALRFAPASALLLCATSNGWLQVFDARDGALKLERSGHAGPIYDIGVSGATVWTAGDDAVCRKFDVAV